MFKSLFTLNVLVTTYTVKNQSRFSFEIRKNGRLSFLDINLYRESGQFVANVYRKETFTGVYTNFPSYTLLDYIIGFVYTLFYRFFCIVFDIPSIHLEFEKLKEMLLVNTYSNKFVDK